MIQITLPDGSVREYNTNSTPMDVAISISEGFARNVISANFNGTTIETKTPDETKIRGSSSFSCKAPISSSSKVITGLSKRAFLLFQ